MINDKPIASIAPALPGLLFVLAILFCSQFPIPIQQTSMPVLPAFAMLYYWGVFRPQALPLWLLFIAALLHDVLYGLVLGSSLSLFVLLWMLCLWMRKRLRFDHFILAWLVFAPLMLGLLLLLCYWQYLASAIPMGRFMDAYDTAFFVSWLAYPLFHLMLNGCYHLLPSDK